MASTLRQRQSSRQNNQGKDQASTISPSSSTTAAFHQPLHAITDQEFVRVVAFGDLPGYSPAYLCVDKTGDSVWVPMEQVKIIDTNALPLPLDQEQAQQVRR